MAELLLTHGYLLARDPHEQTLMRPFAPLGLQYLCAWLRRERTVDVEVWDATFAADVSEFDAVLADTDPRVVGFYGHTITRATVRGMIERCAGRRVVVGGPDPVQSLDEWFDLGAEVVVLGEGELTLQALLEHLRAHGWRGNWDALGAIDGIAFRRGGEIVRTAPRALIRPLDRLPWPVRERSDQARYLDAWRRRHGETAMSLATSRGCPYHCTWCSKQVFGDTFRRRGVEDVVAEVEHLRDAWGPDQLWFVDDMFTLNRRWVEAFCDRMVERRVGVPFYLVGRAETLDAPLLARLRAAGCDRIFLSAESGADHVLRAMRKDTTVAEIDAAATRMRDAGIALGAFVMLGYPGEEKADILLTRDLLRRITPDVTLLSVAHPMKGTAFYDEVRARLTGQAEGGRLGFRMRHGPRLYDAARRMIFADQDLRRKLARGEVDAELVRAAVRYPLWRAAFAVLP